MSNKVKYFLDDKGRKCALFKGNKFVQEDTGYYRISNNWNKDIPNSYRLHRAIVEDSLARKLKELKLKKYITANNTRTAPPTRAANFCIFKKFNIF